ncbi:solute carrier family 35 member F6-like isoform X1 [Mytilus californianus]|uniref:solute carrier family 35 member F6-like isoform X1 n=2 Tax=Mytilus californianus TaxID=6549 RepID=UPI0022464901|nr:solute carrier family 35 member F6-like isoform X1 [Mytilus californianus]
MALSCFQIVLMVGMLVTGSINTISKKAQNDCKVEGYPDRSANNTRTVHEFNHPWFQTLIMFFGEMICLGGYCIVRKKERDKRRKEYAEQNKDMTDIPPQPRIVQLIIAVPTMCDLIGTSVAGIGLIYVDASVWQMLRGSIIIFAGILSKIFLKRKLRVVHWCGMLVTMIGLVLVGCSSVFKSQHTAEGSKTILGIILILASQVVSASQMVIEEMFLKKRSLHPLQVVGTEGSFGALLMIAVVLPVMYFIPGSDVNNSYENSLDAIYQIFSEPRLLVFCLLYLLSIAFYNYFGLAVTKSLTAVHRTLIDACRTILVWVVDLLIFYAFDKDFGEPFDKTYGLLQVDGFLFLLIGTALYNELVVVPCIPCLRKPVPIQEVDVETPHRGNIQYASDSDDDITRPLLQDKK